MAGRSVYFSFNYNEDIWRACVVRKAGEFDARARAGWTDSSLWEEAKSKGRAEIRKLIDSQLNGTSVTAVLIGAHSADREWIDYEVAQSINRGNGLLGVRVHRIRDRQGRRAQRGDVPDGLRDYRIFQHWEPREFGNWVERAAVESGKACIPHKKEGCFACRYLWWVW
jgi:hypothetical protein